MKILILGATGMLGSAMLRYFSALPEFNVKGTAREDAHSVAQALHVSASNIIGNASFTVDSMCTLSAMSAFSGVQGSGSIFSDTHNLVRHIVAFQPHVIINAIGVIKQNEAGKDPLQLVPLNTLLPHFLARLSKELGSRLIHVSTDCVYSGTKGLYKESDLADATDLYGRTKYMGEIKDQRHVITLRTSIIGHELRQKASLLEWFLAQEDLACGYRRALFSGLPTVELARVIREHVLQFPDLHGLYHVSADPIDKFSLLNLIAKQYQKQIDIQANDDFVIDRSLDSARFQQATGFIAPAWTELVRRMHAFG